ncbi:MAG: DUF4350 domain-containing protein [Cyanobacteria bacterium P01_H01_bin.121]
MNSAMNVVRRPRIVLAALLLGVLLMTLIAAPFSTQEKRGSTYSLDPDGYGAWYTYMLDQDIPVQRWQKPASALSTQVTDQPTTLLRVNYELVESWSVTGPGIWDWLDQGNTLVVLGVWDAATRAAFQRDLESEEGLVRIDTTRRNSQLYDEEFALLADEYGAVVWQEYFESEAKQGRIIYATTPHLAANAYQNRPGNFAFLAALVQQDGNAVWIDEYLHGYRDPDSEAGGTTQARDWLEYLLRTPLILVLLQVLVLAPLVVVALNRRFGPAQPLRSPQLNSSDAYMQALAGVLHKAESTDFVVDTLSQAERTLMQKSLGLGRDIVSVEELISVWAQQTGQDGAKLRLVLQPQIRQHRREQDLTAWLEAAHQIRQTLTL